MAKFAYFLLNVNEKNCFYLLDHVCKMLVEGNSCIKFAITLYLAIYVVSSYMHF